MFVPVLIHFIQAARNFGKEAKITVAIKPARLPPGALGRDVEPAAGDAPDLEGLNDGVLRQQWAHDLAAAGNDAAFVRARWAEDMYATDPTPDKYQRARHLQDSLPHSFGLYENLVAVAFDDAENQILAHKETALRGGGPEKWGEWVCALGYLTRLPSETTEGAALRQQAIDFWASEAKALGSFSPAQGFRAACQVTGAPSLPASFFNSYEPLAKIGAGLVLDLIDEYAPLEVAVTQAARCAKWAKHGPACDPGFEGFYAGCLNTSVDFIIKNAYRLLPADRFQAVKAARECVAEKSEHRKTVERMFFYMRKPQRATQFRAAQMFYDRAP